MNPNDWKLIHHFTPEEFDSPDSPGSGMNMQFNLVFRLDRARELYGGPIIISSGYRTREHNAKVGGVGGSAHTDGWAADILYGTPAHMARLIAALARASIPRIGVGHNFIHADSDPGKPQVYWDYGQRWA